MHAYPRGCSYRENLTRTVPCWNSRISVNLPSYETVHGTVAFWQMPYGFIFEKTTKYYVLRVIFLFSTIFAEECDLTLTYQHGALEPMK